MRFLLMIVAAAVVFGAATMLLWNWLLPDLFGWKEIGFLQALGLVVLAKILFGHFGGHMGWRHRMLERWSQMSPEEREKFRAGFRGHCHHAAPPPVSTGTPV